MLPILALAAATAPVFAADNPVTFDFVPVGTTSAPKVATVRNVGTAPLNVRSVVVTGRDMKDFRITSDTCSGEALAPTSSCAVAVAFAPRAAGTRYADLYFSDDTPCHNWIHLAGSGTAAGSPAPAPAARAATCETGATNAETTPSASSPGAAPAPATPVQAASAITLPAARSCASRRIVTVGLAPPAGTTFASVRVLLRGKVVKTLSGRAVRTTVSLKGLPRGRFTLEVRARTTAGKAYTRSHHYVTCVATRS